MASQEQSSSSGFSLEGIQDVQDFNWIVLLETIQEDQGDSLDTRRSTHLRDLMKNGNKAFREDRYEEAVNCYSRAHNIKPDDPIILGNRCAAYLRIGQFLKHRPASASERRPLSGLDPTTHAGLALKDAEQFMKTQNNSVMAYILKANALILLERFELARDVTLAGLQVDASSNALKNLERYSMNRLQLHAGILFVVHAFSSQWIGETDAHCAEQFCLSVLGLVQSGAICFRILVLHYVAAKVSLGGSPSSGHNALVHASRKTAFTLNMILICFSSFFLSVTLKNIIERNFPVEYAERKLEHDSLTNMGPDLLPLFVMDVVLPCQKFHLNIFEARYRLMVRRIMEGNRRMGMVILDSTTGSVAEYACEVEITDCEPLPDGRFFLEVESRRRCRILRNWDQDGYRVAEIEWVQDLSPLEGTKERSDLQDMTDKVAEYARSWIKVAQEAARGDQMRLTELHKAEGLMPSTRDFESFSFWLATLTNRRPQERLDLLRIRDTTAVLDFIFVFFTKR
ncbi:hypothetical protein OSB04_004263 [Centaurea solstitialis]|uniref:Lon N-terminal domain-containing protein n=1 Tax=Centaurea solstitialis TaxID=347529 RepID=A0AA38WPL4_9ASTR|nr:hypothetical protein OSB04_004263 [Centaurea solstitialis]